jgi:hypothetical protein
VGGESTVGAETGSRKRPAADVAPAAEMRAAKMGAAKMPTAMAAATEMRTTAVPTTAVAMTAMTATVTTAMAAAAFRGGIASGRQHGRENNDGNPNIEF